MRYAEFKMTLIIQTIYNILQQCEQWEQQPISLNTSSGLTHECAKTGHCFACHGWFFWLHFSNIHTAAHTTNGQTCCKKKQLWDQTAGPSKQPWDTLGSCRITDLACVHSSMRAKGPFLVNTGGCRTGQDLHCCISKKISAHKRQTDNKEVSVWKFSIKVKPVYNPLLMQTDHIHFYLELQEHERGVLNFRQYTWFATLLDAMVYYCIWSRKLG